MDNMFSKWLKHPSYFVFWVCVGLFAWNFSFTKTVDGVSSQYEASSLAPSARHIDSDMSVPSDASTISTPQEDEEFYRQLKDLEAANQNVQVSDSYEMSPEEIEDYEQISDGTLNLEQNEIQNYLAKKKKFNYETVSEEDLNYLVSYEDVKQCGAARSYIEKGLVSSKRNLDWITERTQESKLLPRKCIAFMMNSFPEIATKKEAMSFKSKVSPTFARCPRGSAGGPALTKGGRTKNPVPCVSKALVNATYNAFVDVMSCLKIEPKDLLPKIYNESGFFINALGGGMDGGIGQLTKPAIEQVNTIYPKYIEEITRAAAAKPDGACARILKNKALITPAKTDTDHRCNLLWPDENPLRNVLYIGILTRYNMKYVSGVSYEAGEEVIVDGDKRTPFTGNLSDQFGGKFKEFSIPAKLEKLGLKDINLNTVQKMITLVGYNSGVGSAANVFNAYLDERIAANARTKSKKYNLTLADFDFVTTKDNVKEARNFLMSSFISPKLSAKDKIERVKKRKQLPSVWASAYTKTFPEYIVLRLNAYKGDSSSKFQIYGFPGYLSALADKNKMIRDTFKQNGISPDYCSSDKFLNFKK